MAARYRKGKQRIESNEPDKRPDAESSIIYGVMPVLESLRSAKDRIRKIALSEGRHDPKTSEILETARAAGIPVNRIARSDFNDLVPDGANHQGVAAYVKTADFQAPGELIENEKDNSEALFVVIDGVEDPRNLGAIIRTAECAGVSGVFLPERRSAGLTDTAVKASAGASEYVKIAKVKNVNRLIEDLKSNDIWVVGASGDAKMSHTEWDFKQRTAIVMGSEGKGLHRLTAEKCDILVSIPLLGKISSLNVSVAAGILLYEVVRQRKN